MDAKEWTTPLFTPNYIEFVDFFFTNNSRIPIKSSSMDM